MTSYELKNVNCHVQQHVCIFPVLANTPFDVVKKRFDCIQREQHLSQTEAMLGVFAEVLTASAENSESESKLGKAVQTVLDTHGGTSSLQARCEELAAYNTNNHLPLVWRFYSQHRKALFDLLCLLDGCDEVLFLFGFLV